MREKCMHEHEREEAERERERERERENERKGREGDEQRRFFLLTCKKLSPMCMREKLIGEDNFSPTLEKFFVCKHA